MPEECNTACKCAWSWKDELLRSCWNKILSRISFWEEWVDTDPQRIVEHILLWKVAQKHQNIQLNEIYTKIVTWTRGLDRGLRVKRSSAASQYSKLCSPFGGICEVLRNKQQQHVLVCSNTNKYKLMVLILLSWCARLVIYCENLQLRRNVMLKK